jgi:hypothetical protein
MFNLGFHNLKNNLKNETKHYLKFPKKGCYFNNSGDLGRLLLTSKHNNLRVISTPEFPVPYYQRISRAAPAPEQITIDLLTILEPPNDATVIRTKKELAQSAEGLKVIEFIENHNQSNSYITSVKSVGEQSNIYADDLVHYLDSAHEENCKILSSVDLADCLK